MRKITGYPLWLGHAGDVRDPARLLDAGISAVVCVVQSEPPLALPCELVYCRFPLVDGTGNPEWLLRAAVETVAWLLRMSTPTLVHCSAGISRSPAVAGAALAIARGCSFAEGLMAATESGPSDVSPALWTEILDAINFSPTRATPFPGFGNRTNTSGSWPGMISRGSSRAASSGPAPPGSTSRRGLGDRDVLVEVLVQVEVVRRDHHAPGLVFTPTYCDSNVCRPPV